MSSSTFLLTATVFLVAITAQLGCGQDLKFCTWEEKSCGCNTDQGLINLREFGHYGIGTNHTIGEWYVWNPCENFNTTDVSKVACFQRYEKMYFDCGVHETMTSSVTDGGYAMFKMIAKDSVRISQVYCLCSPKVDADFIFLEERPILVYNFLLKSRSCCPHKLN